MAVTFGCPLVGTEAELSSKVLKKGQRAYATEVKNQHVGTNWKTGDGTSTFDELPWDLNNGGDDEPIDLSIYLKKDEAEARFYNKKEINDNFENISNKLQGQSSIMDDYVDMNKETADQKYPSAKRAYNWAYDAFNRVGEADMEIQNIKNTLNENIVPKIEFNIASISNVENIAKGANQAIVYDYYFDFIKDIDIRYYFEDRVPPIGNNILIKKLNIPDLWIMEYAKDASDEYLNSDGTYKDFIDIENVLNNSKDYFDEEIVLPILKENGCFYTKYAKIGQLETQKVDLTNYEEINNKILGNAANLPVTHPMAGPSNFNYPSGLYLKECFDYFITDIINPLIQRVEDLEQQLNK